jgi:MOSC domain-containing protein YiiM
MPIDGIVYKINVKAYSGKPGERGLPKQSVAWAQFTKQGVIGDGKTSDFNVYRFQQKEVHPDDRAVLWIPNETLVQLAIEGWTKIEPGHLGENMTTKGIPYDRLKEGQRWSMGEAVIRLTRQATPCGVLAQLPYVGMEKKAAFKSVLEGRRGWYAAVEREGKVEEGAFLSLLE